MEYWSYALGVTWLQIARSRHRTVLVRAPDNHQTTPTLHHSNTPTARQLFAGCLACLCLMAVPSAFAKGDVQFSIEPSAVALGERTAARFVITGIANPPAPELPPMPGFRVTDQPQVSSSTSVENFRLIQSSVVYTYYIQPQEEGTFSIGPIVYKAKGETYNLPAITLKVGPGLADTLKDRLFARLTLPKDEVYVQESTEIILSVYSHNLALSDDFRLGNLPSSGLSFQSFRDLQTERETVNGRDYVVRRFRAHLRGLTAGTFPIAPNLTVPVQVQRNRQNRGSNSLFDSMFRSMTVQTRPVEIQPEPVTITIRPLPSQDRPADFSGAVGDFQFKVKAQPLDLDVGDPITLTMEVTGRGNVDAVSAPALNLGAEFKLYDAKLVSKQVNDSQTHGRKTFEQVLIPRSAAVNEIPTVSFSYFHPDSAEYRTLKQGPFRLTMHENTNAVARIIQAAPLAEAGQDVEIIEEDIVYLKRDAGRWLPADRPAWYCRPAVLGAQTIPPLLALILYAVARRRNAIAQDVARSRRLRAPRQATEGIRRVQMALEGGDNKAYFQAVWDSLAAYFADRLNLAPGEVSEDLVARRFERAGMDPDDVNRLQQIFELCEQARFGLGFSSEATMTDSDRRSAEVILEKLDAAIKSCEKVKL